MLVRVRVIFSFYTRIPFYKKGTFAPYFSSLNIFDIFKCKGLWICLGLLKSCNNQIAPTKMGASTVPLVVWEQVFLSIPLNTGIKDLF